MLIILGIGAGLAVAVLIVALSARRGVEEVRLTGRSAPVAASTVPSLEEISRLARGGQLIEAIKLYRQATQVGLKEARDAVEAIARSEKPDALPMPPPPPPPPSSAVAAALRKGNKLLAIKLYREQTGLGLRESKEAVEQLQRRQ